MKKWILTLTALLLCAGMLSAAMAEATETMGEGTVTFAGEAAGESAGGGEAAEPVTAEAVVPEGMSRAVIGLDDRITISNVSEFPYSAIAYLEVTAKCGCSWDGTGFVAGKPDIVMTAAHCLICTEHGEWANKLTMYFGFRNRGSYMYRYNGSWNACVGTVFPSGRYSIEKDWGIIRVNENLAEKVGGMGSYFGISDSDIPSKYVNVAGYRDGKLRVDSGFQSVLDSDHTRFEMDEVSGNSGGPIFDDDGYAVGIIIAERMREDSPVYNVGYRLTGEIWDEILKLSNY